MAVYAEAPRDTRVPVIPPVAAQEQMVGSDSRDLDALLATLGFTVKPEEPIAVSNEQQASDETCSSVFFTATAENLKLHVFSTLLSARIRWTDANGNTGYFNILVPINGGDTNPKGRWGSSTMSYPDGLTKMFKFEFDYGFYSRGKDTPFAAPISGRVYKSDLWNDCDSAASRPNTHAPIVDRKPRSRDQNPQDTAVRAA